MADLPTGWQRRIVTFSSEDTHGATGHCLDPHDLVVAKLVASRMKDMEFADALLHAGLVESGTLLERARLLEVRTESKRVTGWVVGWVRKHG